MPDPHGLRAAVDQSRPTTDAERAAVAAELTTLPIPAGGGARRFTDGRSDVVSDRRRLTLPPRDAPAISVHVVWRGSVAAAEGQRRDHMNSVLLPLRGIATFGAALSPAPVNRVELICMSIRPVTPDRLQHLRSRVSRPLLAVAVVATTSLTGLVTTGAGTAAAAPDPSCLDEVLRGGTCEITTVGDNLLTVPAGLTQITVIVAGASGANGDSANGGRGGLVVAEVRVAPSETLNVLVGAIGNSTNPGAGFRSGGSGRSATVTDDSGGGGGATAVLVVGDETNPRVVAGGGGGAGGTVNTAAPGGDGGDGGLKAAPGGDGVSPTETAYVDVPGGSSIGAAGGCTDGASSCGLAGDAPSDSAGGDGVAGLADFGGGGGGGGGFPNSGWGGGRAFPNPDAPLDPSGGGGGGGGQSFLDADYGRLLTSGTAEGLSDGFVTILPGGNLTRISCTGPDVSLNYYVPVDTNAVVAIAAGGAGGQPTHYDKTGRPGRGALAIGRISVTPGDILNLVPGCEGYGSAVSPGAATGGAGGHAVSSLVVDGDDGGGGGGASEVRDSSGVRLLTAGGGGGSGGHNVNLLEKPGDNESVGGAGGDAGLGWGPSSAGNGGISSSSAPGGQGGASANANGDDGSDGNSDPAIGGGGGGGGGGGVVGGQGGGTDSSYAGGGGGSGSSAFDPSVQFATIGSVAPGADNGLPTDDGYIILIPVSPPTTLRVQIDKDDHTAGVPTPSDLAVDVVCTDDTGAVVYNTTANGLEYGTPEVLTTELDAGTNCVATQSDSELAGAWSYELAQGPSGNVLLPGDNLYRLVDHIDQIRALTMIVNNDDPPPAGVLELNVSCARNGVVQTLSGYTSTDLAREQPLDGSAIRTNPDQSVTLRFSPEMSTYTLNYDGGSGGPLTGTRCTATLPDPGSTTVTGNVAPAGTTFYSRDEFGFSLSGTADATAAPSTFVTVDTIPTDQAAVPGAEPGPSGTGTVVVQVENTGDGAAFANRAPTVTLSCPPTDPGAAGYTDTVVMPVGGGSVTVTGVPVGSACTVREGVSAGATAVSYQVAPRPDDAGPAAVDLGSGVQMFVTDTPQTVSIANRFDVGTLTVRVTRDGSAAAAPQDATFAGVRCTFNDIPVAVPDVTGVNRGFDGPGGQVRSGAPLGAICTASPITDGYTAVAVSPPAVITADGAAELTIAETYDAGTITVRVAVQGSAAAAYRDASFGLRVRCVPVGSRAQSLLPFDTGQVTVTAAGGFVSAPFAVPAGFTCGAAVVSFPGAPTAVANARSSVIVDAANQELLTTVTVDAAAPVATNGEPTPSAPVTAPALASTGVRTGATLWTALVLLGLGAGLTVAGRRRHRAG